MWTIGEYWKCDQLHRKPEFLNLCNLIKPNVNIDNMFWTSISLLFHALMSSIACSELSVPHKASLIETHLSCQASGLFLHELPVRFKLLF